jgi:Tol biopolymer transport system component
MSILALMALLFSSCSWVEHNTDPFAGDQRADGALAFASDRFGDFEIFVVNADGSGMTRITAHAGNDMFPTWSPNADFLVFSGERLPFNRELYRVDREGEETFNLTQFPGGEVQASWSPDGAKIAFVGQRDLNMEIYVMDADGSNQTRLTHNRAYDGNPTWSPDGSKIAFSSGRALYIGTEADSGEIAAAELHYLPYAWHTPTFNNQLYVMDADGGNVQKLTDTPFFDEDPSWSPDGSKIAFVSNRDGNYEIYVMRVDGSELRNITLHPGSDSNPSWSPDGTKIAFVSDRDGSEDIFIVSADGSNLRALVQTRGRDISPAWMPQIGFSTRERCLLCPRQGGPNLGL